LAATYEQIAQLLWVVENTEGYRDWDWLDNWLSGRGNDIYTPEMVRDIYTSEAYWQAVKDGNTAQMESIKRAILGTI
jgi:hypothetical protein